MKKLFSVFMCVVLLLSVSITVSAKNPVELNLTNATVYAGDEFEVKLFISDNSKMSGAVIDVNYDNKVLEFISAETGSILDNDATKNIKNFNKDKSYVRFTYMSPSSAVTSEGILLSIRFKALETAVGSTAVSVSIPHEKDFVNSNLEVIDYKVNNSIITIINENASSESNVTDDSSSLSVESSSSSETTESTSNNNDNNTDEKNGSDIIIVIGVVVAGVVILIGVICYIIYDKNKKRRGNEK